MGKDHASASDCAELSADAQGGKPKPCPRPPHPRGLSLPHRACPNPGPSQQHRPSPPLRTRAPQALDCSALSACGARLPALPTSPSPFAPSREVRPEEVCLKARRVLSHRPEEVCRRPEEAHRLEEGLSHCSPPHRTATTSPEPCPFPQPYSLANHLPANSPLAPRSQSATGILPVTSPARAPREAKSHSGSLRLSLPPASHTKPRITSHYRTQNLELRPRAPTASPYRRPPPPRVQTEHRVPAQSSPLWVHHRPTPAF